MKKTITFAQRSLVGTAVLTLLAGAAQAQSSSVTIYGRLDAGIEYVDKVSDGMGGDDSLTKLQNGGILPSIWGFRGSEDLGGGLKAVFNLEGDFDSGTGGERFGGSNLQIFGRQANVGLSGGWGTVLLGRQYSPALLADLGTEPRGFKESFSSLLPYALQQAPAGNTGLGDSRNNFLGIFIGNMISYSGTFGPVAVGVGYGFGEQAADSGEGEAYALGLTYNGPVIVSGSYQLIKGIGIGPDAQTERYSAGVAVPLGAFTIKAYYHHSTIDGPTGDEVGDVDNFGVGADFRWNEQNTLTVAYYMGEDDQNDNAESWDLVISNDYALSKRSTLYAQFVYSDYDDNPASILTSVAADRHLANGVPTDESVMIFGVGLKHDF